MNPGYKCRRCKAPIDESTYGYTMQRFKLPLCTGCQAAAIAYEKAKAEQEGRA